MTFRKPARLPKSALRRYAEIILRHVYQSGGRDRYVSVAAIEDSLGIEEEVVLEICRTRLLGEVHVADRVPAALANETEFRSELEWQLIRMCLTEPHVRIRPAAVRLTESELVRDRRRKKRKRRNRK